MRNMAQTLEFPAQRIQTVSEIAAQAKWAKLTQEFRKWFHEPDIGAFQIALAVAVTHYFKKDQPVWLMILGAPGSGKTTMINMIDALDEARQIDDLTPKTLLSGFNSGNSLLHRIGTEDDRSAILLMPDFSTIVSMRDDSKRELASQFRRVFDGKMNKEVGVGRSLEWEGKITMIVAATPAAERAWSVMRDLGERFMQVRWPRGDGIEQARAATTQIGEEQAIMERLRRMTRDFVDLDSMAKQIARGEICKTLPDVVESGIAPMADMVAHLRGHVHRDRWDKEILEVQEPEGPTRIMKAMSQLARASAAMFRRANVERSDLALAKRLGLDSIPQARRNILSHLLREEKGWATLVRATGLPPTSMTKSCEDMVALGILKVEDKVEKTYSLSEKFAELVAKAAPVLNS